MMRLMLLWVLGLLLCTGCSAALPSAAEYPSPVSSAAQPGVSGKGAVSYARRGAAALRDAAAKLGPEEAVRQMTTGEMMLEEVEVAARCTGTNEVMPLLVCQFGPDPTQPVAQVILWYEREGWESQLYPQASPSLAQEREEAFADFGCRVGCYSGIRQIRQAQGPQGTELLTVVDVGFAGGIRAEEVHLLRLRDRLWEVVWVPGAGDWNYGHASVTLAEQGVAHFGLQSSSWLRQDKLSGYLAETESGEHRRFRERWVRKGNGYTLRDQIEEETPYSALIRLIHYLSTGGDEKALSLLDDTIDLETARKALAQKPRLQGWAVTRWGASGYLLDTQGSGKPDVQVRFEQTEGRWLLAEIRRPE